MTAVSLHRLNVLGQATALAFSLTSLAQQIDEIPLALAIVAEVGGLLALLGANVASERMTTNLYQVVDWDSKHKDDEPRSMPDPEYLPDDFDPTNLLDDNDPTMG